MRSSVASKLILRQWLGQFKPEEINSNNVQYLEQQLEHLQAMSMTYAAQSINKKLPPRIRARSRDLQQNCIGLINGIKFALSFIHHEDINLLEQEEPPRKNHEGITNK